MSIKLKRKSIIFVTPYSYGVRASMEKYAFQMVTELEKIGISCNILPVNANGVGYFKRLILPLFSSWRLLYCREKIIYVHYAFFINFIFLLPFLIFTKIFGKKIIIQIHEYWKYLPFKNIVKFFDLLYCITANVIIVHNSEQYKILKKYGFKKVELLHMPTDQYIVSPKTIITQDHNKINILMHGGIIRKKGYEIGIKALSLLPSRYIMTLIGAIRDKKYYEELLCLIKELKLEGRIIIINRFLPEYEYEEIIKNSDILIYPYSISTASAALAEGALKFEKPFLTSNIDSFITYIGQNNYSFKLGDYVDLSEKILHLDQKKCIELCSKLKKQYSRKYMGQKLLKTFNSLD